MRQDERKIVPESFQSLDPSEGPPTGGADAGQAPPRARRRRRRRPDPVKLAKFVALVAAGHSGGRAVLEAGWRQKPSSAKSTASRLLARPDVRERVERLRATGLRAFHASELARLDREAEESRTKRKR